MATPEEVLSSVKSHRGLVGQFKDFFLAGYESAEKLRANDKNIRMAFKERLEDLRSEWNGAMAIMVEDGSDELIGPMKSYLTVSDRVVSKVEHAPYGYAGFHNRLGKVDNMELAEALAHDMNLAEVLDSFSNDVNTFLGNIRDMDNAKIKMSAREIVDELEEFENKFKDRKNYFVREEV